MPSIRILHCRFKSRIRKQNLTVAIIGVMFMFQPPIFADSVYDLNNYPSQQGGGTLTGSITVLDSAADDGVLVEAEIVKWDFVATNSAFPFPRLIAGSSVDALLGSRVQASNISIDDDSITIHVTEHCVQTPDPLIGSPCASDFHQRLW